MAEVITPGWSPDGASFRYEELRLRNEIWVKTDDGGQLLAVDNLLIRPPANDVTGLGFSVSWWLQAPPLRGSSWRTARPAI